MGRVQKANVASCKNCRGPGTPILRILDVLYRGLDFKQKNDSVTFAFQLTDHSGDMWRSVCKCCLGGITMMLSWEMREAEQVQERFEGRLEFFRSSAVQG